MSTAKHIAGACRRACLAGAALLAFRCAMMDPEVMLINRTAPDMLIVNPSFNGTLWNTTLAYGKASSPQRCPSGSGHVHFKRYNAYGYCRLQARYDLIDSLCLCDSSWMSNDTDVVSSTPVWYPYRTITRHTAGYGDFLVVEITLDDMEQDFSAPRPHGH